MFRINEWATDENIIVNTWECTGKYNSDEFTLYDSSVTESFYTFTYSGPDDAVTIYYGEMMAIPKSVEVRIKGICYEGCPSSAFDAVFWSCNNNCNDFAGRRVSVPNLVMNRGYPDIRTKSFVTEYDATVTYDVTSVEIIISNIAHSNVQSTGNRLIIFPSLADYGTGGEKYDWNFKKCLLGYYLLNNVCTQCPKGKFSFEESSYADEVTSGSLTQTVDTCIQCPQPHTTTPEPDENNVHITSEDCVCDTGFIQYDFNQYPNAIDFKHTQRDLHQWCIPISCSPGYYWNDRISRNLSSFTYWYEYPKYNVPIFEMTNYLFPSRDCFPCVLGFYRSSSDPRSDCIRCPIRTTTTGPGAGTSLSQCLCELGRYKVGTECVSCNVGFYKDFVSNAACLRCPVNSSTLGLNSISKDQCECKEGMYGRNYSVCELCPIGTYKNFTRNSATCVSCPAYSSTLAEGATRLEDCKCNPGFTGPDGTSCRPCDFGTYKSRFGDEACRKCRENSKTNDFEYIANQECECVQGYYNDADGVCQRCPLNSYKDVVSNAACTPCPNRSITLADGSDSLESCLCDAGARGPDGGPCVECEEDTYKDVPGASACLGCPLYSVSPKGFIRTDCYCSRGFTGPFGGPCLACPPNFYKDTVGDANCTFCGPNLISPIASNYSTDCQCELGYTGPLGGPCVKCSLGKYKDIIGADLCLDCPLRSTTLLLGATTRSDCVCDKGSTGPSEGPCIACSLNFYKDTIGDANCTFCGPNLVTLAEGSDQLKLCLCDLSHYGPLGGPCRACDVNSRKEVPGASPCLCMPGFTGLDNGVCTACDSGKYKEEYGSAACQTLPLGVNTFACPSGTYKDRFGVCQPYTPLGGGGGGGTVSDDPCPVGTFRDIYGSGECTPCFGNTTTLSTWSTSSYECTCRAGYEFKSSIIVDSYWQKTCVRCGERFFKSLPGDGPCFLCRPNSWTKPEAEAVQCVCQPEYDYDGIDVGDCQTCAVDTYWDGSECRFCPRFSFGPRGRSNFSECLCKPGYSDIDSESCKPCGYGSYKPSLGNEACTPCLYGLALNEIASINDTGCACPFGYYDNDGQCDPCPAGTYKPTVGNTSCLACKANSVSDPGSKQADFCLCRPGFFLSGGECIQCEGNAYKEQVSNVACTPCGLHEVIGGNDKTRASSCVCDIGYYRAFDGSCVECNIGEVKWSLGPGPCVNPLDLVGCDSLCRWGERLEANFSEAYAVFIESNGVCGNTDPTAMTSFSAVIANYSDVNATEEVFYDRWGFSVENWKNKTRLVVPPDYLPPECYYFVSSARPSVIRLSASVDVDEAVYTLELHRCQTCGYVPAQCKSVRTFDLLGAPMEGYEVQIDVYSCLVLRVYSSVFPLLVARGLSPTATLEIASVPPTCECRACNEGDTPIPILRTSYVKAWASESYGNTSVEHLDALLSNVTSDVTPEIPCILPEPPRSSGISFSPCSNRTRYLAVSVRFTSHASDARQVVFRCSLAALEGMSEGILAVLKLDGAVVYSSYAYRVSHYAMLEVTHGEHLLECYGSVLADSRIDLEYYSWQSVWRPFSVSILDAQGAYECAECELCSVGQRPREEASRCPCEDCPRGTYGVFEVGPEPYHCRPCSNDTYSSATGLTACLACPANSMTGIEGSDSVYDCRCTPGYSFQNSTLTCEPCPAGTYKPETGNVPCTPCPDARMSSWPGSSDVSSCLCLQGFVELAGNCEACPENSYWMDPLSCEPCPYNMTSPEGTPSLAGCVCQPGYTGANCSECERGYRRVSAVNATGHRCILIKDFVIDVAAALHTCALFDSREAKCWGLNDVAQLGLGDTANRGDRFGTMGNALPVLEAQRPFLQLAASRDWTCALFVSSEEIESTSLRCWGNTRNDTRDLRLGPSVLATPSVMDFGEFYALQVCAGERHGCGIFNDGRVRCWGNNNEGQLGIGDRVSYYNYPYHIKPGHPNISFVEAPLSLACGHRHTCVLLESGQVYCWGSNQHGQLGFSSDGDVLQPTQSTGVALEGVTGILARGAKTCVHDADLRLECWGFCADQSCGSLVSGGSIETPRFRPSLPVGRSPRKYALAVNTSCALLNNNDIVCWGSNQHGQLGIDNADHAYRTLAFGDSLTPVIKPGDAVDVFAGYHHFCYVNRDGDPKCWGFNAHGQLGYENTENVGDFTSDNSMRLLLAPINVGDIPVIECEEGYYIDPELFVCRECSECVTGTFPSRNCTRFNDIVCQPCGDNMTSPYFAKSYRGCECGSGYRRDDKDAACRACYKGEYKISSGDFVPCDRCLAGRNSSRFAMALPTGCQCPGGFFGPNGGDCEPCPPSTYKDIVGPSQCVDCPEFTGHNASGAASVFACRCLPGYYDYGAESGGVQSCRLCPEGKYMDTFSQTFCKDCPELRSSKTGSSSLQDCVCQANYFYDDILEDCLPCPKDYFRSLDEPTCRYMGLQYISCPANTSLVDPSNISLYNCFCNSGLYGNLSGCRACPLRSVHTRDRQNNTVFEDCQCRPGHTPFTVGECKPCPEDSYKESTGNGACTPCRENFVSLPGSVYESDCVCLPGFQPILDNGTLVCEACPASYYKNISGNEPCLPCPNNSYSDLTGLNSFELCICRNGYYGTAPCMQCDRGFYSLPTATFQCVPCPANSYSPNVSSVNASSCLCKPGHFSADGIGPCEPCPYDRYQESYGQASCERCDPRAVTRTTGTSSGYGCLCLPGYSGDGYSCQRCPFGTFKERVSNEACKRCPLNAITNASVQTSVVDCLCVPGYLTEGYLVYCEETPEGTYQPILGQYSYFNCPNNSLSNLAAPRVTDCRCRPGYSGEDGEDCLACPADTYKAEAGNRPCLRCPGRMVSPPASTSLADCVCPLGYGIDYGIDNTTGDCLPCWPRGYNGLVDTQSPCLPCPPEAFTRPENATSFASCACLAGYSGYDVYNCTACQGDTYKTEDGFGDCLPCPEDRIAIQEASTRCYCRDNLFEFRDECYPLTPELFQLFPEACSGILVPDNTSIFGCRCQAGSYDLTGFLLCLPCGPNQWSDGGRGQCYCNADHYPESLQAAGGPAFRCLPCPGGRVAPERSPNASLCTCPFCEEDGVCVVCPFVCPEHSFTVAKPYKLTDCVCEVGYYLGGERCERCPAGYTTASTGSIDIDDCICDKGFELRDGVCQACPEGHYKPYKGSVLPCKPCGANTEPRGTGNSNCRCRNNTVGITEVVAMDLLKIDTHNCLMIIDDNLSYPGNLSAGSCRFSVLSLSAAHAEMRGDTPLVIFAIGDINISSDLRHVGSRLEGRGAGYYGGFCYFGGSGGGFGGAGGAGSATGGVTYGTKELWPWGAYQGSPGGAGGDCNLYDTATNEGGRGGGGIFLASEFGSISVQSLDVSGEDAEHAGTVRPGGGGSGGAILLVSPISVTAKDLVAEGGSGFAPSFTGGAGGGGRVALWSPVISYASVRVGHGGGFNQLPPGEGTVFETYLLPDDYTVYTISCSECRGASTYRSYYDDAFCFYCGDNSVVESEECRCERGYEVAGDGRCVACAEGFYKNATGGQACRACPIQGAFTAPAATRLEDCICNKGFFSDILSGTEECRECPKGTYQELPQARTSCVQCPPTLTTQGTGTTKLSECTCAPGTIYDQHSMVCNPCRVGEYFPDYGFQTSCFQCPTPTVTQGEGSTDLSQCKCVLGYYYRQDTKACVQCEAGKYDYEELDDFLPCLDCPAGTYNIVPGSAGLISCVLCPRGTFSTQTGLATLAGCQSCPQNTYQQSLGASSCIDCPALSMTLSNRSISASSCLCVPGYTGRSVLECVACGSGTYKPEYGDFGCTPCPLHTHSDAVGLDGVSGCTRCPFNMFTSFRGATGVRNCTCNPGSYFVSYEEGCVFCSEGYYQPLVGMPAECTACPAGRYNPSVGSIYSFDCLECPLYSSSPQASVSILDCRCDPGRYRDYALQQCLECPAGKYGTDNQTCEDCPADRYLDEIGAYGVASCKPCTPDSRSPAGSASVESCLCDPGFAFTGGQCQLCAPGSYKATQANEACLECPAGSYSGVTGSKSPSDCLGCLANSVLLTTGNDDIMDCECGQGYERINSTFCGGCEPGYYKDVVSNAACTPCDYNTYSTRTAAISALSCLECPLYSNSDLGSTACECNFGYVRGSVLFCEVCPAGTYDSLLGESCTACGRARYSTQPASFSEDDCQPCPLNSDSPEGSDDLLDCVCNNGHHRSDDETCSACLPGQYKPLGSPQLQPCETCPINSYAPEYARTSPCSVCPENSTTHGRVGMTSLFDCICNAGYYGNSEAFPGVCLPCPANSYCPGGQNSLGCFPNSSSPPLSVNHTACRCDSGFVAGVFSCSVCPANYYCPAMGDIVRCPFESDSDPGSRSEDDCYCKTGYVSGVRFCGPGTTGAGNGLDPCVPCAESTYKEGFGSMPCTPCPYNLSSRNGSRSLQDCVPCDVLYNLLYQYDNATGTCKIPGYLYITEDECPPFFTFEDGLPAGTLGLLGDCRPNCNRFLSGFQNILEWRYEAGSCVPVEDEDGTCGALEYFDRSWDECVLCSTQIFRCPAGTTSIPASTSIHQCTDFREWY
jgi:alpha-tubulin suppressor-like RCC1 family protein